MHPDEGTVSAIKSKFAPRPVHELNLETPGGESYTFLMTGPNRLEWRKYRQEMSEADKNMEKVESAVERAALAQIRWPDREKVLEVFDLYPGIIQGLADKINEAAGFYAEAKTKKL